MFLIRQFFDIILSPAEKYSAGFLFTVNEIETGFARIFTACQHR